MTSTTEKLDARTTASVRSARLEEFDAVGELTVAGFSVGPYPPDAERRAQLADAAGRAATADLRVAVGGDGELLGTVTLAAGGTEHSRFAEPHELEFRLLAVSPDARRRGIGALLLEDSVDRARERGFVRLVLDTGARNEAAQRLYHRAGFSRLPERENRLGRGGLRLAVFGRDASPVPGLTIRLARPDEVDAATRAAHAELWVAVDTLSGEPLGSVTLPRPGRRSSETTSEDDLDLGPLTTAPHAHGRGVGPALLRHALDVARWRGLRRVVLHCDPQDATTRSLCTSTGFVRLPTEDTRVVEGVPPLAFAHDV